MNMGMTRNFAVSNASNCTAAIMAAPQTITKRDLTEESNRKIFEQFWDRDHLVLPTNHHQSIPDRQQHIRDTSISSAPSN
jgi:hypothetical protein